MSGLVGTIVTFICRLLRALQRYKKIADFLPRFDEEESILTVVIRLGVGCCLLFVRLCLFLYSESDDEVFVKVHGLVAYGFNFKIKLSDAIDFPRPEILCAEHLGSAGWDTGLEPTKEDEFTLREGASCDIAARLEASFQPHWHKRGASFLDEPAHVKHLDACDLLRKSVEATEDVDF